MDPIYLVPAVRAKFFDGTNAEEIAAWTGYELVEASEAFVRLRVAPDEVTQINVNCWVFASVSDPPTFAGGCMDWELRTRYVVHPGPVTAVPPAGEQVTA